MLDYLARLADHIPTTTAAKTGAAGATVSIAAAVIEPGQIEMWLRIATIGVGLLTGLGSGGLVALKYYDRWRGRRDAEL